MKLLFIGATGLVGRQVVPLLRAGHELTLCAMGGGEIDGVTVADVDITQWGPVEALVARGAAQGEPFESIVNCAIAHYRDVDQTDPEQHRLYYERCIEVNARGAYHVFEAARRAGVPRVVYISSFSIMNGEPHYEFIAADARERPDDLYAAAKLFGEHVGRSYAYPQFGGAGSMIVICLRLGSPFPSCYHTIDRPIVENPRRRAMMTHWEDIAGGIEAALRTQVRYGAYPILSANDLNIVDDARCAEIGYAPAWRFTAEGLFPVES